MFCQHRFRRPSKAGPDLAIAYCDDEDRGLKFADGEPSQRLQAGQIAEDLQDASAASTRDTSSGSTGRLCAWFDEPIPAVSPGRGA